MSTKNGLKINFIFLKISLKIILVASGFSVPLLFEIHLYKIDLMSKIIIK